MSIEVGSIIHSFGQRNILSDVYFKCEKGDIVAIFGRNGTEKTTFFNILFGTQHTEGYFIRIDDQVITGKAFKTKNLLYLPQNDFLPRHLSVLKVTDLYLGKDETFFEDDILARVKHLKVKNLSGGEVRYLEIMLILSSQAPYIILDEPFNGLSPLTVEKVRKKITQAAKEKCIIFTDHNFEEVHRVASRLMILDNGYLKQINDPEELIPYRYYISKEKK